MDLPYNKPLGWVIKIYFVLNKSINIDCVFINTTCIYKDISCIYINIACIYKI